MLQVKRCQVLPQSLCSLIIISGVFVANAGEIQQPEVILTKCIGFQDYRNNATEDVSGSITIPHNLTNSNNETATFGIEEKESSLDCQDSATKVIKWEHGTNISSTKGIKSKSSRLRVSGKNSSHFTHEGFFHDKSNYYKPNQYCIKNISDAEIALQVCTVNCTDPSSGKHCIPKCCGAGEVLVYWNFTCRKLTAQEKQWKPSIHGNHPPHDKIEDAKELEKIHIFRKYLHCNDFEPWPISDVMRPKIRDPSKRDPGTHWKLLESERPVFFGQNRTWIRIPDGEYCVDGFANWGFGGDGTYLGDEDKYSVLLHCPASNFIDKYSPARAWTYVTTLIASSAFLLFTAVIHLLLLDKQHLHGLTVLCYSLSVYFMYIFFIIAHFVSLFPSLKGQERGIFCTIVGVLAHYFFMTTFTWLTVMNFDLWLTFRSMRPVSKMSKRIRRFWLYFTIGWGFPMLLSAAFYGIDHACRHPDSCPGVVVPDYAIKTCFVAIWSRGEYMYSLVAIALSINTIIVAWTFYIFYEFRKQNSHTFSTKRARADKYSVRLFIKLFCVMGVAWFVELLSWKYNGEAKPWAVVVLDCVVYLLQAISIFFIFCVNRRTLAQLEEKYRCLRIIISPMRTVNWLKASDVDGVEMTTPGSTPRKLSVSTTNNTRMDSTLPRKASTSSSRSMVSNNKFLGTNGKMESIPLDADLESSSLMGAHQQDVVSNAPDLISNT